MTFISLLFLFPGAETTTTFLCISDVTILITLEIFDAEATDDPPNLTTLWWQQEVKKYSVVHLPN